MIMKNNNVRLKEYLVLLLFFAMLLFNGCSSSSNEVEKADMFFLNPQTFIGVLNENFEENELETISYDFLNKSFDNVVVDYIEIKKNFNVLIFSNRNTNDIECVQLEIMRRVEDINAKEIEEA